MHSETVVVVVVVVCNSVECEDEIPVRIQPVRGMPELVSYHSVLCCRLYGGRHYAML